MYTLQMRLTTQLTLLINIDWKWKTRLPFRAQGDETAGLE